MALTAKRGALDPACRIPEPYRQDRNYGWSMAEATDEKRMKLRYAGTCRMCGTPLAAREEAIYERATETYVTTWVTSQKLR